MNILIYNSGGGLGDCIQLMSLLTSLKYKFSNSTIWYLGAHENHFDGKLNDYNIKLNNLNLEIKYFGFRWKHLFSAKNKYKKLMNDKFDIIIDLQSKIRNTLILKRIPTKIFYSSTLNFIFCSKKFNYLDAKYDLNNIIKNLEKILNTNIPLIKYDIKNINKIYFEEASKLLPYNKITRPTKPDKVPITNFVVTFNNLNDQIIIKVKTGTTDIIKVRIPASIFGATTNSTLNGIIYASIPATEKNRDFFNVNLKSFFCKNKKIKNKAQRTVNSETKIVKGLSSASTNLTREKCNAHNEDNANNNAIFLY